MAQVILSIGTNLGNRFYNLLYALELLNSQVGTIEKISKIYETEPWGFDTDKWFFNIAVLLETNFSPFSLLDKVKNIEKKIGRTTKTKKGQGYESRLIDIDIIFFEQKIIKTTELSIPHPLVHKRNFVLYPLMDIAPDFEHPLLNCTVKHLVNQSNDKTLIKVLHKSILSESNFS